MYTLLDSPQRLVLSKFEKAVVAIKLLPFIFSASSSFLLDSLDSNVVHIEIPGLWHLLLSLLPGSLENHKTQRRIFSDSGMRYLFFSLEFRQMLGLFGQTKTIESYRGWASANAGSKGADIEDIPEGSGSQMFWVRRDEDMKGVKVLYYVHGGGFMLPIDGSALSFLDDAAKGIEKASPGLKVSIAVLDYSKSNSTSSVYKRLCLQSFAS